MQTIYNPASIYHEIEFAYEDGTLIVNTIFTEIEVELKNSATGVVAKTFSLGASDVVLTGANSAYVIVDTEDVANMTNGVYETIVTTEETDSRFSNNKRIRKGKENAFELKI